MTDTVALDRQSEYDADQTERILRAQFAALGVEDAVFKGKTVVLKPNLVTAVPPEKATTTHPTVLEAAARIVRSAGGRAVVAESGGGPYSEAILRRSYRITGIEAAASAAGAELNYDTSSVEMNAPNGVTSKLFEIIRPIAEADVIINLAKLKTHTLTTMTGATKNLFGTIPGIRKVEQHARFGNQRNFQTALIDLCDMLCTKKRVIHICDAVVAMEGNGPSGGSPRAVGCIMSSENPYALDIVGSRLIGLTAADVPMLDEAVRRGLTTADPVVIGSPAETLVPDFLQADGRLGSKFDRIPAFLKPRPQVNTGSCTGCGTCARCCPAHTIEVRDRRAVIDRSKCIRCFCCQELCPVHAVSVHKNFIFNLIT